MTNTHTDCVCRTVKDFSNTTDLCIQEAGSHICRFGCTRSFLFQRGCILRCIGIVWFLHTWGGLRNSTSSCHWSLDWVCHTWRLRSQANTPHETRYESPLARSLLPKCHFFIKQGPIVASSCGHVFGMYSKRLLLLHLVLPTHPVA